MAAPPAWYRAETARIRAEIAQATGKRFLFLNLSDLDGSWDGYRLVMREVFGAGADLASTEALDYFRIWLYDEFGEAMAEGWLNQTVRIDLDDIDGLLARNGPIEVKRLIANGWKPEDAFLSAMRRSANIAAGYVHKIGQESLTGVMAGHHQYLQGWRRIISPNACSFCKRLERIVYRPSDKWVKPHDKCGCTAEPVPNALKVQRTYSPYEQARNQRLAGQIARRKQRERDRLAAIPEAA